MGRIPRDDYDRIVALAAARDELEPEPPRWVDVIAMVLGFASSLFSLGAVMIVSLETGWPDFRLHPGSLWNVAFGVAFFGSIIVFACAWRWLFMWLKSPS